jgi:hypothetical protein
VQQSELLLWQSEEQMRKLAKRVDQSLIQGHVPISSRCLGVDASSVASWSSQLHSNRKQTPQEPGHKLPPKRARNKFQM